MKPVRSLPEAARAALDAFGAEHPDERWEAFRNHDAGRAYRELREALVARQFRLCAYCEIDLGMAPVSGLRVQVEHFIEKSRREDFERNLDLDSTNLLAVCTGGGRMELSEPYYSPPLPSNLSCGQSKTSLGKTVDIVDPRHSPLRPAQLHVEETGNMQIASEVADPIASLHLSHTMAVLGLQCRRLVAARKKHWEALIDLMAEQIETGDIESLRALARRYLLPDEEGVLTPFWTTTRSFFGELAEDIITDAEGSGVLP